MNAMGGCQISLGRNDLIFSSSIKQQSSVMGHSIRIVSIWRALHKLMPRWPMLLATASRIDVNANALAEAGVAEVLRADPSLLASSLRCWRAACGRRARYERNAIPHR
jgi:hypothetical protein